jgi:hypothetical protein
MTPRDSQIPSFELQPQDPNHGDDYTQRASLELKPSDRGRHAWTVLIAGVVFEALFWGSSIQPHHIHQLTIDQASQ